MDEETNFKDVQPFDIKKELLKSPGNQLIQTRTIHNVAITVPKPRNLDKIIDEVMEESRKAKDSFYYTWPVKNRKTDKSTWIIGGTVDLAQAIARSWTNCAIETICREHGGEWIFKTTFIDFEKGFTTSRELRQLIPREGKGDYDQERTRNMAFQVGQSKNQRDAIFNGVPRWLKNQAIEMAKLAGQKDTDYDKAGILKKAIDFFTDKDISIVELCAFFNVKELDDLTGKDIGRLRNLATQLTNGDITAGDIKKQAVDEFERANHKETGSAKQTKKRKKQAEEMEEKKDEPQNASAKKELDAETETRKAAIEKGMELNQQDATELKVLQDQIKHTQLSVRSAAFKNLRWTRHSPDWIPETVSFCKKLIDEINNIFKAEADEKGTRYRQKIVHNE